MLLSSKPSCLWIKDSFDLRALKQNISYAVSGKL